MKSSFIVKSLLALLLIFLIIVFGSKAWKDYQVEQDQKKMEAMYSQILDGSSTQPTTVNIAFNKQISKGSPLIFGGSHSPKREEQDAWNKIEEVGITSIRYDFAINWMIRNTTIDHYKKNTNNIQDINNWDTNKLDMVKNRFVEAKKRGMKTIGIVDYTPSWLTENGQEYSIPKDWDIYEDLVRKTYTYYRPYLDYVEVWNEPNFKHFFRLEGLDVTPEEAYRELYYHAAKAIREVDSQANDGKIIPIGGPVASNPIDMSFLKELLRSDKTKDKIDFVSYHNYDAKMMKEPSWIFYKDVLKDNNKENLPVFITEWNSEPDSKTYSSLNTTNDAIPYVGGKFVDYLKMGLTGANYHVIEPLDARKPNEGEGYMGFYKSRNNEAELLPQAKTWRLMSTKMKLGKGESTVYNAISEDTNISGIGFKNLSNEYGYVIVNNEGKSKLANVVLSDIPVGSYVKVSVYVASGDSDAKNPSYTGEIKRKNNAMNMLVYLPKKSVIGVTINEDKTWYDFMNFSSK